MAYQGGKWTTTDDSSLPGARINVIAKERATSILSPRGIVAIPMELDWGAEDDIISYVQRDYTRNSLYNFGYNYKDPALRDLDEVFQGATEVKIGRLNAGGEKAKCDLGEAKWSGTRGNDFVVTVEADSDAGYVDNELADVKVDFYVDVDTASAKFRNVPYGYTITGSVFKDGEAVQGNHVSITATEDTVTYAFTVNADPGTYELKAALLRGKTAYTISTQEVTLDYHPETERSVELVKGTEKPGTAVETADATFTFSKNRITVAFSNVPEGYTHSVRIKGQVGILGFVPGRLEETKTTDKHYITYYPDAPANGEMTVEAVLTKDKVTVLKSCTYTVQILGEDKDEFVSLAEGESTPVKFDKEVPAKYIVRTFLDDVEVNKQKVKGMYQLKDTDFVVWVRDRELELTAGMKLEGGTNGEVTVERYNDILNKLEIENFHCLGWPTTDEAVQQMAINFTIKMRDEMGVKFQTVMPKTIESPNYEGIIQIENAVKDQDVKDRDAALVYWVSGQEGGCKVQDSVANMMYTGAYTIDVDYSQRDLENLVDDGYFVFHLARGIDGKQYIKVLLDINTLTEPAADQNDVWKRNQSIRVMDQCCNDVAAIFNNNYFGKVPNTQTGREQLQNDIINHHLELEAIQAIEDFDPSEVVVERGEDKVTVLARDAITPVNAMERLYMTIVII